jgi:hypothetical protein
MVGMEDKNAGEEMMEVTTNKPIGGLEDDDAAASAAETNMVETRTRRKRLTRKIDIQLLPILFLMLVAAFLDRINIGNARLFGLEGDLNMHGDQFNIVLFIFFVPYILCELPANMLLKNLKPHVWLSTMIVGFGKIESPF